MSSNIAQIATEAALSPNPLDVIPEEMPVDVPYGLPILLDRAQAVIQAAVTEAKKRKWKMNIAVTDSSGNLVAFQRMDGAMLSSIQVAEQNTRLALPRRSAAKPRCSRTESTFCISTTCSRSMESLHLEAAFR